MKQNETASDSTDVFDRLEQIRISPEARRTAQAYLRQGELLAELLMRAHADLRRAFAFVGRGIGAFARRSKASAVRPEPN